MFFKLFTLPIFPGLWGFAIKCSNLLKLILIILSYFEFLSGINDLKSFNLPWAFINSFVTLSAGNIEVKTPASAPIFVIVALSGTDKYLIPLPLYSIA